MDGWADPWADGEVKQRGHELPTPPVLGAYQQDDAGWGDYGGLTEDGWGSQELAFTTKDSTGSSPATVSGPGCIPEEGDGCIEAEQERSLSKCTDGAQERVDLQNPVPAVCSISLSRTASSATIQILESLAAEEDVKAATGSQHDHAEAQDKRNLSTSETNDADSETASDLSSRTRQYSVATSSSSTQISLERSTAAGKESECSFGPQLSQNVERMSEDHQTGSKEAAPTSPIPASAQDALFAPDVKLLVEIFGPRAGDSEAQILIPDLIDSISTRKSWYRLTRSQTLRAFKQGDAHDTYVRVAWPTSQIRQETLKIVSRWTTEDRISGRTILGGARKASFGWGQPNPRHASRETPSTGSSNRSHSATLHSHDLTSVQKSSAARFGWSTSLENTWEEAASNIPQATPPPSASPRQSWDKTRPLGPVHELTPAATPKAVFPDMMDAVSLEHVTKTPGSADAAIRSPSTPPAADLPLDVPSSGLGLTINEGMKSFADNDDFEDWGEMVQSPTVAQDAPGFTTQTLSSFGGDPFSDPDELLSRLNLRKPTPTPITDRSVPVGPLSPARLAAYKAAKVTQTLSSQNPRDLPRSEPDTDAAPNMENALTKDVQILSGPENVNFTITAPHTVAAPSNLIEDEDFEVDSWQVSLPEEDVKNYRASEPPISTGHNEFFESWQVSLPASTPAQVQGSTTAALDSEGVANSGPREDEWALFESAQTRHTAAAVAKHTLTESRHAEIQLSAEDVQRLERFWDNVDDLSFMLK